MLKVDEAKVVTSNYPLRLLYLGRTSGPAIDEVTKSTCFNFTISSDLCWSLPIKSWKLEFRYLLLLVLFSLCRSNDTLCDVTKSTNSSATLTIALQVRLVFENFFLTMFNLHREVFPLQRGKYTTGSYVFLDGNRIEVDWSYFLRPLFLSITWKCDWMHLLKNTWVHSKNTTSKVKECVQVQGRCTFWKKLNVCFIVF